MTIRRIQPLSLAKMMGAIYALLGLLFGALFAVMSIVFSAIGAAAHANQGLPPWFSALFGVGAILFMPVIYGVMGFLGGLIAAALYNLLSGRIGGVVLEVDERGAAA